MLVVKILDSYIEHQLNNIGWIGKVKLENKSEPQAMTVICKRLLSVQIVG